MTSFKELELKETIEWLEAKLCDIKNNERIVVNAIKYLKESGGNK